MRAWSARKANALNTLTVFVGVVDSGAKDKLAWKTQIVIVTIASTKCVSP